MANGAFTPGTGTLKSTNLVAAFLELSLLTQTSERIALANQATLLASNLTVPDNVNISADYNGDTMTVSIGSLPITATLVAGKLEIEAIDYLSPLNAVVSAIPKNISITGSQLTNTSRVKALLELAMLIQEDEADMDNPENRLTMNIDLDNNVASINASFNGIPQINATGLIEFVPINYLVN